MFQSPDFCVWRSAKLASNNKIIFMLKNIMRLNFIANLQVQMWIQWLAGTVVSIEASHREVANQAAPRRQAGRAGVSQSKVEAGFLCATAWAKNHSRRILGFLGRSGFDSMASECMCKLLQPVLRSNTLGVQRKLKRVPAFDLVCSN
jgi:hypothetical protein